MRNTLPATYKDYERVQTLLSAAKKREDTGEGKMFVDFTIKSEDGQETKLSDYVGKGDYVLVDFWASWCRPCRESMPQLKEIYKKYSKKKFQILGVAVWDNPEDTYRAMEQLELPWPQIINAQTIPTDAYGVTGIPHLIIFGPDGTILSRGLNGDALAKKIEELMNPEAK